MLSRFKTSFFFLSVQATIWLIACKEQNTIVLPTKPQPSISNKHLRVDPSQGRLFGAPTTASGSCYDYNDRVGSTIHAGKDYCGSTSDDILAAGSGRISMVSNLFDKSGTTTDSRGLGKTIIIGHKMPDQSVVYTLYAHLSSINADIVAGKYVTKGYPIGKKGKTGAGSNEIVHLHFEYKNDNVLGNNPNCQGNGCVGYTKNTTSPANRGYFNPNSFTNSKEFYDLVLDSNIPNSLSKAGVKIPLKINNPFSGTANVDLRLSLFSTAGNYLGDIQAYYNIALKSGSNTITFSKASLSSAVGNYYLQLSYKVPNSGTWLSFPTWGSYINPVIVSIKK